ncbi:uncharacterized protein LOC141856360 isoform X2 [Brevipalpus obovatus]|uniref:uncharacterized protein LOC141856360 isoform X2 n=1 Tax=Brevipalpus obovatus TaxID=246614 RepID=UPI003D9EEF32
MLQIFSRMRIRTTKSVNKIFLVISNFNPLISFTTLLFIISVDLIISSSSAASTTNSSSPSSSSSFICPEQFGYFEDQSDCSKYFVCVFGEPLHESCTGGLYFSSELQTCDWPRNVQCGHNRNDSKLSNNPAYKSTDTGDVDVSIPVNTDNPFHDLSNEQPTQPINGPPDVSIVSSSVSRINPSQQHQHQTLDDNNRRATADLQLSRSNLNKNFASTVNGNNNRQQHSPADTSLPPSNPSTIDGQQPRNNPDITLNSGSYFPRNTVNKNSPDTLANGDNLWKISDEPRRIVSITSSTDDVDQSPSIDSTAHSANTWDARGSQLSQDQYFRRVPSLTSSTPSSSSLPSSIVSRPSSGARQRSDNYQSANYDMTPKEYLARNPLFIRSNQTSSSSFPLLNNPNNNPSYYRPSFGLPATSSSILTSSSSSAASSSPYQSASPKSSLRLPYSPPYAGFETSRDVDSDWSYRQADSGSREGRAGGTDGTSGNVGTSEESNGDSDGGNNDQGQPPTESPWSFATSHLTRNGQSSSSSSNGHQPTEKPLVSDQANPLASYDDYVDDASLPVNDPGISGYNNSSVPEKQVDSPTSSSSNNPKLDTDSNGNSNSNADNNANNRNTGYRLGSILLDIQSGSGVPSEHGQPFGLVDYEDDDGDQVPAERREPSSTSEDGDDSLSTDYQPAADQPATPRPWTRVNPSVIASLNITNAVRTPDRATINQRIRPASVPKPLSVPVLPPTQPVASPPVVKPFEQVVRTSQPLKPSTKCDPRVCHLPNCNCGSSQIPSGLGREEVPQIVMISFEDAINDLNWNIYEEIFDNKRKNPNGCSILGTFYVSHEWTDYGHVQTLYSRGHEIASHGITHSFGEKFSKLRWQKEIHGQREFLNRYAAVRTEDVRGMRAPFLQIGGNNMFQMLYESNFTYDSSMPVFDNYPPFWPYTLDYAINHECMITPCPSDSFPGVWEVDKNYQKASELIG